MKMSKKERRELEEVQQVPFPQDLFGTYGYWENGLPHLSEKGLQKLTQRNGEQKERNGVESL
jgi:hypothetical protein